MVIGGERDRTQCLLPNAMLVHVALHPHRKPLRRRQHTVRHQIGSFARNGVDASRLPEPPILALRQRAEHHDTIRQAHDDRGRRVGNRRAASTAAATPLHRRRAQLARAQRRGQPRRLAAIVAVGGEPVDLAGIEPGIRARRQNGFQRQLELRIGRRAMAIIVGLADPDDRDPAPQRPLASRAHRHGLVSSLTASRDGWLPKAPPAASCAMRASS